jgi:hypothetical protein
VPSDTELLKIKQSYTQNTSALTFDASKWQYDSDNQVYYQIGVSYCASPEDTAYETMGIYVPAAYMTAKDNGNGTFTCTVNASGKVGNYTASSAPIVLPVNTPGYSAQKAPTSYSYNGLSDYLSAGFIYVYAGMRGRANMMGGQTDTASSAQTASGGAPFGVTDLKAAVRYYRLNSSSLPGNTSEIYSFGMSGGGAQSALMGSTGDSSLYYSYLEKIGAAMYTSDGKYISDAVTGSMCWCPITTLDEGDEAYEWNMGQFSTADVRADGTFTAALSKDLAKQFAEYINKMALTDSNGSKLSLTESSDGIYLSGSYYDYMVKVVETSLNNFLSDTTFPYTENNSFNASGNFGGGGAGGAEMGNGVQGSGNAPAGAPSGAPQGGMKGNAPDMGSSSAETKTYNTVQEYIDSLNADGTWVTYDASANTAKITGLKDFVTHMKTATKGVGAFDAVDASQGENGLFGNGSSESWHFDTVEANLINKNQSTYSSLSGWDSSYLQAFTDDLKKTDEVGNTTETRVNMYNPMYYLNASYAGYQTSNVAKYWRIRTGIEQSDTALTTETNLALALQSTKSVKDVDFATVWGMKHTMAERTGSSTTNFIEWVNTCVAGDK